MTPRLPRTPSSRPGLALLLVAALAAGSARAARPGKLAPAVHAALQGASRDRPDEAVTVMVRLRDPGLAPRAALQTGATWDTLSPGERTALRRRHATETTGALLGELGREGRLLWISNTAVVQVTPEEALGLAERPEVEAVVPDLRFRALPRRLPEPEVPAAPAATVQAAPSWGISGSGAAALHGEGLTGKGMVIGHIDTGVDGEHPHFRGRIHRFRDFLSGRARPYDDHGHGTHTLGIMVGGGPGASVAPEARAVVARALDVTGEGKLSTLLRALQWMIDPDGDPSTADQPFVVNSSWGIPRADMKAAGVPDTMFWDAVTSMRDAGILPVFSSGNDGPGVEMIPGGYPHALAVGAATRSGRVPTFSSGATFDWSGQSLHKPDLVAPGLSIVSAARGGGTRSAQGTSQAAPHVAGIAALMHQAAPSLSPAKVHQLLLETAQDRGPRGRDTRYGEGILDGVAAVRAARRAAGAPPPTRPPSRPPATRRPAPPTPPATREPSPPPPPATRRPEPPKPLPPLKRPPRRTPEPEPAPVKRKIGGIVVGVAALLGLGWLLFR